MAELLRHIRSGRLYEMLFRGARVRTVEPLTDYDLVMIYRCSRTGQVTLSSHKTAPAGATLLYMAAIQAGAPLSDGAEVVVYRALDGNLAWARSTAEMNDGRFEAVPCTQQAGTVSILEERIRASIRYFRDGAAVWAGVPADQAENTAVALQDLLSDPVPACATEAPDDAIVQARRLAAAEAEERFQGDLAALFVSGRGDDHPWVRSALRGLQAAQGASENSTVDDKRPPTTHADREHATETELQEIRDGAYGDNPMIRGLARDQLVSRSVQAESANAMTEDEIHAWLCRHYTQAADARQRAMGLSYTTAETRDLARQIRRLMDKNKPTHPDPKPRNPPSEAGAAGDG